MAVSPATGSRPLLPDYGGACISSVYDAVRDPAGAEWLPASLENVDQVVLLVVDGLGWEQLVARPQVAPTLASMIGGPILSVVPSTTASALTSISTGLAPAEHGLIGYRMAVDNEPLNVLRWRTAKGDARHRFSPESLQPHAVFRGDGTPVITRAEFIETGFTVAHLRTAELVGYRLTSALLVESIRALATGARVVYAYYDGVDKVAHEFGLGEHYDAELAFVDSLVRQLIDALPSRTGLVVTSDHGQVHVGDRVRLLSDEILGATRLLSGEGRFRWLHARSGRADELLEAARSAYAHEAWVVSREQILDEKWFGPRMGREVQRRLGDVAIVPFEPVAYHDPDDLGPFSLVARHGSLTSAEMLVPLVATAN